MRNLMLSFILGLMVISSTLMANGLPISPSTTTNSASKPRTTLPLKDKVLRAQNMREKGHRGLPGAVIRFEGSKERKSFKARAEDRKETKKETASEKEQNKNAKVAPAGKKIESKEDLKQRELSDQVIGKVLSEKPQH